MPLRFLLFVLLLLNVLLFAGGYMGWLGKTAFRGEPERLTNQLHPERIRPGAPPTADMVATVDTTPRAAPSPPPPPDDIAAVETAEAEASAGVADDAEPVEEAPPAPPPPACVAYEVTGEGAATEAEKRALTLGDNIRRTRTTLQNPENWRVRIPPLADQESADARVRRLREQGVSDLFVVRGEDASRNSISLGQFSTEARARQRLATLKQLGVGDAEIVPGSAGRYRVEFRAPADVIDQVTERLDAALSGARKRSCRP
jgi:hypothetical protein